MIVRLENAQVCDRSIVGAKTMWMEEASRWRYTTWVVSIAAAFFFLFFLAPSIQLWQAWSGISDKTKAFVGSTVEYQDPVVQNSYIELGCPKLWALLDREATKSGAGTGKAGKWICVDTFSGKSQNKFFSSCSSSFSIVPFLPGSNWFRRLWQSSQS